MENKQAVAAQAQKRMLTDKTLRKKNTVRVKERLLNDNEYRNINKLRAAMHEKKRRTHPELREQELAKMRNRMKAKLSENTQYRQEHRAQMRQQRRLKLQNDGKYRQEHRALMRQYRKSKLQNDEKYKDEHRLKMRQRRKSRLENDQKYRDVHRQKMKIMYNKNPSYHYANKTRAKTRYQHLKCGQCHKVLTDKQKYWLRRSRLLAVARRRTQLHSMQKRMESESGVSLFNISLLFNIAEHDIKTTTAKTKRLRLKITHSIHGCLQLYQQITHPLKQTWSPHLKGNVATQQQANHTSGN